MALTGRQQERLRQLLEDELRKAGSAAIERGATPEEIADLLAERRRALADAPPGDPDSDRQPSDEAEGQIEPG
ncbi:hypothetical protein [Actinoplanes auranticolor]|uniref:Uncharacterized protein n=1 Tax=Actinoplanes auranticolor TaxID=47988 RepID=A0A919S7B4_9ACTN|nr:hypothetical protein [Actinoplanes auranticolor]GIM66982.1 hypothetical protein Aau02nite_25390 [Actinoplanes auranticolor]